jgi:5,10-methylene-tetrahydrofolate dehydrogenase/methenyl tetrahydrofolate cyclohydrolase
MMPAVSGNATLLDGSRVAQDLLAASATRVARIRAATGATPCLATVLVGDDPASVTYTRMKRKRCESVGMRSLKLELAGDTTTEELLARIRERITPVPGGVGPMTIATLIAQTADVAARQLGVDI